MYQSIELGYAEHARCIGHQVSTKIIIIITAFVSSVMCWNAVRYGFVKALQERMPLMNLISTNPYHYNGSVEVNPAETRSRCCC